MSTNKATLYLIGAGPGDPELLTIKALKTLNKVDVVLYDNLINRQILDYIENPNTKKIFAGKSIGESFKQDSINQMILNELKAGNNVARLKGGDPLIFARGIEEAQIAIENNFDLEIIPGLTTAFSAAALNLKTLTLRNEVNSLLIATGHQINQEKLNFWIQALNNGQVLILYMGLRNIVEISEQLKSFLGKNFPITAIYKASLIDQKIIDSDLEHIAQELINQNFESPVIFYIGKNLNHLTAKIAHNKELSKTK